MAKKKKRISKPVAASMPEPMLVAEPKSRSRQRAEIAVWSVIVLVLYFYYRAHNASISSFLSSSYQVPVGYTLDYSMGFLPRALSGQLLTFFTGGSITGQAAGIYFLVFYAITYGLFSLILGMLISKAISAKNYLLAMFPLLIIFPPLPVWYRSFSLKHYDMLMLLITFIAFLLIRNEKLMWFVPVCACLGIMTNYSYILLFFPLLFAIQYYELVKSSFKRIRLYNLIGTTVASFALTIYMLWASLHSELVSKYSFSEAIAYLERRAGYTFTNDDVWYIAYTVFGRHLDGQKISFSDYSIWSRYDWFEPIFYVTALLICAPIVIFALAIWRRHMKGEKGFWKKSPFILFMLAPAIIFPAFLFFGDMDRLVSAALFTQTLLLAYAFFTDGQNEAFLRLKEMSRRKRWLLYAAVLLGVIVPLMIFRSPVWLIASSKQPIG